MSELLAALCLVFVIEGLLLFASPAGWKRVIEQALSMPDSALRRFGAVMVVLGLIALQIVR